jgi:hypothetical protein
MLAHNTDLQASILKILHTGIGFIHSSKDNLDTASSGLPFLILILVPFGSFVRELFPAFTVIMPLLPT